MRSSMWFIWTRCFHNVTRTSRHRKAGTGEKQMQLLHLLLPEDGEMDLGDNLLELAQKLASGWW